MKQRDFTKNLILDWLLLVPGLLGSVFCLITAFSLPASGELWGISIGAVTLFSVSLGYAKRDRITILLLVALAIPAYLFRVELVESFRNLWGVLSSSFAKGYDFFRDYVPRESTTKETVGTALLCLTVLEAFFCCLAVRVWKRTTPAALALMICVAPCFILTDTPPDVLPLLAVIFSVLTQAFSQSVRRRAAGEQGKAVLASALLSAAILGLLLLLFPQKGYTPPITWEELAVKMEHWKREQNNRGNVNAGLTGNPLSVDLSGLGALPNRPFPIFYVNATQDGHLYLRGSSYTDFDGMIWTRDSRESWSRDVLFPYLGTSGDATLTVETVEAESLLYTTYQLTQFEDGALVSDAYLRNDDERKKYTMQYSTQTEPLEASDLRYDAWVQEHCLALPERTREGVSAWWREHAPSDLVAPDKQTPDSMLAYCKTVAEQVSRCARYSRNPVQMPEGEDFCTWFLNDATEGYCVHYASSCVALLRAMGIPSRYVSGYVCDAIANKQVRVTNLQAHAWVEVWLGGRWVPIEPTPADATEFAGSAEQGGSTPETSNPPEASEPKPASPEPRPHVPATRPTEEKTSPSESDMQRPDARPDSETNKTEKDFDFTPLGIFLAVIGVPLLIVGRRSFRLKRWERRYYEADNNGKARLLYRRMCRIEKLGGEAVPNVAVSLAKKAGFSQHTLSENELTAMRKLYAIQSRSISSLNIWKRFFCKFILAIC